MNISNENIEVSTNNNTENSKCLEQEKTEVPKGTVIEGNMSQENSDYDSADSYSDTEQQVKIRSRASDEQSHSDEGSVILERQEGDGQESIPTKKVDDDEDKKNPQYIPKKGTFYEHDDRTVDDEENETEAEKDKDNKKKVWQDKKEVWTHDKFNDLEQAPKSRAELVAIYGYDIRNEEGPPRARRRRRYGRGPNKYTRTWEDEAAYVKATPTKVRTKKQREPDSKSSEEFPPLVENNENKELSNNFTEENQPPSDNNSTNERRSVENYSHSENNKRKDQIHNWKPQQRTDPVKENSTDNGNSSTHHHNVDNKNYQNISASNDIKDINNKNASQRTNSGRVVKPRKEITESDHRGFTTKTRQLRPVKNDKQKVLPPRNQQTKEENPNKMQSYENSTGSNAVQELEKNINKLSINEGHKNNKTNNPQNNQQRQNSVPPRLQNEQKGSKRYSSMRQRSLPETNTPPAVQTYQHGYYPNEYNQQSDTAGVPQPLIHQAASIHHPTSQVTQIPPQPIPLPQQVTPVTAAPILQAPFPQGFPPAPPAAFLPAPPASYIPPQSAQIINYVQGQPAFNPNYQGFQQQFNPVHELLYSSATDFSPPITTEQLQTPQTELYQPQGGITYYSTDQQITQRSVPQKRPKVAIPIVAPPSEEKDITADQQSFEVRNEVIESTEGQQ